MSNYFCVYDFETDSVKPDRANPVEVACLMLDPYTLEEVKGSEFVSNMRPPNIDSEDYLTPDVISTIGFHAKLKHKTQEEIIAEWKTYPSTDVVWNMFVQHVNKYNRTGKQFDAPYSAGQNIKGFDNIITDRLNAKYKVTKLFNYESVDLRDVTFLWLRWDTNLKKRSMDSLRPYFGISTVGAHEALKDVRDTGLLLSKFLKLHKELSKKVKFKDSCLEEVANY